MNIPTLLTLLRIALIPVFVLCYYIPGLTGRVLAVGFFVIAAVTDWLDGYLARKWNQTSALGAFLDPVADKLMVAVALVMLVSNRDLPYLAFAASVIIGREIVISALREWMAELGKRANVAVSMLGKVKTASQMLAIILLLAANPLHKDLFLLLGYVLLYIAAILTLWSMCLYLKAAWPNFESNV